jgi:YHS domain-containing protein
MRGEITMAQRTEARDPVCDMIVDVATAQRASFQGETYYFCSDECRKAFEANPAHYAARATQSADLPLERHEPKYTKKGGIVAPKFGSAGAGGAEYELLPEAHDDEEAR